VIELRLTLPEGVVEEIARRAAEIVLARLAEERPAASASPYLTVGEAAEYLRASRQRVYDLLSAGRLTRHKDGSRVLVARAELDAYLAGGNGRRGRP
jgi:excisionase family DNA binding protein